MINHQANGYLVPPRDVPGLARGLITLLNDSDLRLRLGDAARNDAVSRFAIARYMEELHLLYRATADPGPTPTVESLHNLQVKLNAD
jgi:glycosyltransferase involved in cell wall biosynthesis